MPFHARPIAGGSTARARLLKPGFFANEALATLTPWHRLLFAGLWTLADRQGRLLDRPGSIRVAVFPYDGTISTTRVDEMLTDLVREHFIIRYAYVTDRQTPDSAIAIPTFLDHQNPHHREPDSRIPPPFSPRPAPGQPYAGPRQAQGEPEAGPSPDLGEPEASLRPASGPFQESGAISEPQASLRPALDQPSSGPAVYGVRCTESVYGTHGNTSTGAENAPGASDRTTTTTTETPADNLGVLTKIAHELLDLLGPLPDDDLREAAKRYAAERHVRYDARTIAKAVDVARAQRRRRVSA